MDRLLPWLTVFDARSWQSDRIDWECSRLRCRLVDRSIRVCRGFLSICLNGKKRKFHFIYLFILVRESCNLVFFSRLIYWLFGAFSRKGYLLTVSISRHMVTGRISNSSVWGKLRKSRLMSQPPVIPAKLAAKRTKRLLLKWVHEQLPTKRREHISQKWQDR